MGKCDKCGEERGMKCANALCQGDAAHEAAVAIREAILSDQGVRITDPVVAIIAWKMRAFVREQVFAMGDEEVKRLLGEVAHGSFADRGRGAAKAALNQAQLTVLIEKAQAVVDDAEVVTDGRMLGLTDVMVISIHNYHALADVLPKRERPERPTPGASRDDT